jgi:hypothetical protein
MRSEPDNFEDQGATWVARTMVKCVNPFGCQCDPATVPTADALGTVLKLAVVVADMAGAATAAMSRMLAKKALITLTIRCE